MLGAVGHDGGFAFGHLHVSPFRVDRLVAWYMLGLSALTGLGQIANVHENRFGLFTKMFLTFRFFVVICKSSEIGIKY